MDDPGDGTIPENMVVGRAFMIVWPPSRWRILQIASTFDQPGIDSPSAARAAGAAAATGTAIAPAAPYLPLEAGFVIAVPLTLVQRWARRRRLLSGLLRHGRGLLLAWRPGALRARMRRR